MRLTRLSSLFNAALLRRMAFTLCLLTGSMVTASAVVITITGTVLDDGNGGTISGIPISSVLGNQLYVYLIDNSNSVVDRAAVSGTTFTYSLSGLSNVNYSVGISTAFYAVNSSNPILGLPQSFVPTAEGTSLAGDGTPDYAVAINSSTSLTINFAVDARPTGYSYALGTYSTDANNRIIIPSGAFTGNDPEDGTYGPGFYNRSVDLFQATGGALYYNGVLITFSSASTASRIANFDVNLLRFQPLPTGQRQFAFSTVDNAGVPEAVPNSITLPGTALPISFASFSGKVQDQNNHLMWQTASESSNKGFIIERSEDGAHFASIATVASKGKEGNSSQPLSYDFIDYGANAAVHAPYIYRIRQTNFDGGFNYSNVVRLTNSYVQDAQLSLAPNPTSGAVSLDMATGSASDEQALVSIYSATGSLVLGKSFDLNGGRLTTALDLSTFPAGTYYIQMRSGNMPAQIKQLVLLPH